MSSFQDPIECYEAIASLLSKAVPEPWSDIRVKVELDEESVDMTSDYAPSRSPRSRREIDYVPGLGDCFYDLARLVSTPEKGLYKRCVFILSRDGKYDTQFEY